MPSANNFWHSSSEPEAPPTHHSQGLFQVSPFLQVLDSTGDSLEIPCVKTNGMSPEMSDMNPTEGDQAPKAEEGCCLPTPTHPLPRTRSCSSRIPRAEGSGVRTMNITLARSPELSRVTPPRCKKGGGDGQKHIQTTALKQIQEPRLLQSGKQMSNSNSQIVFLLPSISWLQQRQDLTWALLLGDTEARETNLHHS